MIIYTFYINQNNLSQYLFCISENLEKGIEVEDICLKELVYQMRIQRHPWMVEGVKQYQLLHDIVIYLLQELTEKSFNT